MSSDLTAAPQFVYLLCNDENVFGVYLSPEAAEAGLLAGVTPAHRSAYFIHEIQVGQFYPESIVPE